MAAIADLARCEAGGIVFRVRLTPRGGRDSIDGAGRDAAGLAHVAARVAAPPEEGRANAALVALLAEALGLPRRAVTIRSGQQARVKLIQVEGDAATLAERLAMLVTKP
jgi:hypothetical protein